LAPEEEEEEERRRVEENRWFAVAARAAECDGNTRQTFWAKEK